ncbi:MAG TPA: condensation domain-containing protein, partial [Actinoplanes sp.]|nr:condensation domain-containing protein [Actinoplanes sp.]
VDTHFLSPADTESCLYAVEALAVRAAFDRSPAPAHCRARLARTAERIAVPFAGSGAGDEPLAWGQSEVWQSMQRQRDWMPLGGRNPLPPGTSADDIAELLRYLMSRHPSMRTRLRTDDGVLRQVVAATGTARLEVVDAGDADPDEVAAAVEHRYRSNTMDHRHDWPVRMAVIRRHGELTHQVTIVSHLAIDAAAGALMLADLAARPTGAVAGMSTLEQARWQRSPAGVRQQQRSMRYWSAALHRLPTPEPVDVAEPDEPRHWLGRMSSRALPLAVQAVAERTGADSGHVLLALTAMALGACTGRDPVALRPLVNNRFRRDLAQTVAPVTQHGILVLDVAGLPFDDVLDRVSRSTMAVYKHAYFDPAGLQQLVDEVTAERGPVLRTACFVNDRRSRTAAGAQAPTAGQIRAALAATQLHLTDARDVPFNPLFLVFDDEPDALAVEFQVDTHCMPVSQLVALVRDLERLAVSVACAEVGS